MASVTLVDGSVLAVIAVVDIEYTDGLELDDGQNGCTYHCASRTLHPANRIESAPS